jgi:crossover junction endodeoxyribonuclease RuvC
MKILGVDPSIRSTGWAVIEMVGAPDFIGDSKENAVTLRWELAASGIIKTNPKDRLVLRLTGLYNELDLILHQYYLYNSPVCVETPFVHPKMSKKTALVLGQVLGVCSLCVWAITDQLFKYAPREIKKTVAGSGAASKEQVREAVSRWIPEMVDLPMDISDATATALTYWMKERYGRMAV